MTIGIDVSQVAYEATGVGNFVKYLVESMIENDKENTYILFFSSFRNTLTSEMLDISSSPNVITKIYKLPPSLLDILWNKLHILPIELFIGNVDVFLTSDWTEPPARHTKKITILYDLIVYTYPEETHDQWRFNLRDFLIKPNIVASQKRRLKWVKREAGEIICISEATKRDAIEILGIDEKKLKVVYPGM